MRKYMIILNGLIIGKEVLTRKQAKEYENNGFIVK